MPASWVNMLSMSAMSNGQWKYYSQLSEEDYHAKDAESPGMWLGQGAEALGLSGQVQKEELRNLFRGYSPDGTRPLVQIQDWKDRERQPGWDLTFSPSKDISTLGAVGGPEVRKEIEEAHFEAVKAGIGYIEDAASFCRRGKGGCELEPAKLVVAAYQHETARAVEGNLPDPQLHTHALVLNVGVRPDGTTGAILSQPLYKHKMAAGAIYRAELSYQLEKRLGLKLEREESWFKAVGVPEGLTEEFSKRRHQIEESLDQHGTRSAKAAAAAALATREKKEHFDRSELRDAWQEIGRAYGFTPEKVEGLLHCQRRRSDHEERLQSAVSTAVKKLMQSHAHFSERDLVRYAAEEAQGKCLSASVIREAVREELEKSPEIVRLGRVKDELRYTTREMLKVEKKMLDQVEELNRRSGHIVSDRTTKAVLAEHPSMKEEQKNALLHVANGADITVISGMAGTGKTFLLEALRKAYEREGREVIGVALAGKAAQGLEDGAGIKSQTIHRQLWKMEAPDLKEIAKYHLKQLVRALKGKSNYGLRTAEKFGERTVLVVDEAGMVGTRQMAKLIEAVRDAGAKLILVGDARQLQPIECGAPFKSIGERHGQAELKDIIRQKDERDKENVRRFARGDSHEALADLAKRGLLTVAEDPRAAMRELISAWKEVGVQNPTGNIIIAGTNLKATVLNRRAQEERRAQGLLVGPRVKVGTEYIHENDRILFTQNSIPLGVRNGYLGTVVRVDPMVGKALYVRLDSGRIVYVPLKSYQDLQLGYAITTHKGQGITVKGNIFALVGGPMQDREMSYVQASRAEGTTRLFTDRIEAGDKLADLAAQMSKSRQKDLAHDHLPLEQSQEHRIER
jgi:conjugative relaxase-like TrwC/TraI family protein